MSTPEYVKRANNTYNSKFDIIQVKLDKGTKSRIKAVTNESFNNYIKRLVYSDLESAESANVLLETPEDINIIAPKKTPEISGLYGIYNDKLHEFVTQLEIQEKYGNDVLLQLSDYAKKAEQAENIPGE